MKTNAQFDDAWRDLMAARRSENLDQLDTAAERLNYAIRMLQLDRMQTTEEKQPVNNENI